MKQEIEKKVKDDLNRKQVWGTNREIFSLQAQEQHMKLYKEKEELILQLQLERQEHAEKLSVELHRLEKKEQKYQALQQLFDASKQANNRLSEKVMELEMQTEKLQAKLDFEILARKQAERRVHQDQETT